MAAETRRKIPHVIRSKIVDLTWLRELEFNPCRFYHWWRHWWHLSSNKDRDYHVADLPDLLSLRVSQKAKNEGCNLRALLFFDWVSNPDNWIAIKTYLLSPLTTWYWVDCYINHLVVIIGTDLWEQRVDVSVRRLSTFVFCRMTTRTQ